MARFPVLADDEARPERRTRLGRAGLDSLMRDPRYWDADHPEHEALVDLMRQGFDLVFGTLPVVSPTRGGARSSSGTVFDESFTRLMADEDGLDDLPTRDREALGRSVILDALERAGHRLPAGFAEAARDDPAGARRTLARGEGNQPSPTQPREAQTAQAQDEDIKPRPIANRASTSGSHLPPPTQEPIDLSALYRALDFDREGRRESIQIILNPVMAAKVGKLAEEASKSTAKKFPQSRGHNDEADAYRHALWSFTIARELGHDKAKSFTDAHEVEGSESGLSTSVSRYTRISRPNTDEERAMDLYNNAVGRQLAQDPKNCNRSGEEVIMDALKEGKLQLRLFQIRRGP